MYQPPELTRNISHYPIRIADWIELNLITEEESSLSVDSVTDELADSPPDDADSSETRSGFDYDDNGGFSLVPGYWDTASENAEAAFLEIRERADWLGQVYPLETDGTKALLNGEQNLRDVYRFLVLLRARHLYHQGLDDNGAESGLLFEELAKYAIGGYIGAPSNNQARFGVAGGFRGDGLPLPIAEAARELSDRMDETLGEFDKSADGDFRGDAVAWKSFGDSRPGQLVVVCQATISERRWQRKQPANEWTDKQPPTKRLIQFVARPVTALAFPETLSLTTSDELDGLSLSSIPFDRLRLLSTLNIDALPDSLMRQMNKWASLITKRIPIL